MPPRISLLVTCCGRSEQLERTLARCRAQAREAGAELLLVVNEAEEGLPAGDADRLRALADRALFVPEPGKSRALNAALPEARGQLVAFCDDDAEPDAGWLAAITAPLLEPGSRWTGVGGAVHPVFPAGGPPPWFREILARHPSIFLGPQHRLGPDPVEYRRPAPGAFGPLPFGASCAYRKDALLARPFPEHLGPNRATGARGGEDTAVALRLLLDGHRLLHVPAARVYHPVTPERMTVEYAREGYAWLAEETILLHELFGVPLPAQAVVARSLRRARRRASSRFASQARRLRHDLRAQYLQRQLQACGTA